MGALSLAVLSAQAQSRVGGCILKRTSVRELAAEAKIDLDEALVTLWDNGFPHLSSPAHLLNRGEANRARRALGLSTRRELASPEHWQRRLGLDPAQLEELLVSSGVPEGIDRGRLRKKAIRRLLERAQSQQVVQQVPQIVEAAVLAPSSPPFMWEQIGRICELRMLTVDEVQSIHWALVDDFKNHPENPIDPPGLRSEALLVSALYRPLTSNQGIKKYPTVEMAAAALFHSLVHDHAFHNGNKRTALVATLVFLDENGMILTCDEDALFKLVLQLAQHTLVEGPRSELADREIQAIALWFKVRCRWMEKGDRPITWRRLRSILTGFACSLDSHTGVGNRINISRRVIVATGILGMKRERVLQTQTAYGDEGREVDKNAINRLRKELHLDDAHGVDSRSFYEGDAVPASEFIIRYRKTLRRLAPL